MKFYQHGFQAMGTPCDIQLYAQSNTKAQYVLSMVLQELQRLEARYSRYRNDSYLSAINRVAAQGGTITVDAETAGLLNYAAICHAQSDGLFDITSGILRRLWRFDQHTLPAQSQIDILLQNIGWHKLHWQAPLLQFPQAGMELDFGGIVKEYAADRCVGLCWEAGIRHGLVNLGGDIKIIGPRPDQAPWCIGLLHPREPSATLKNIFLTAGAVASSGDYERCLVINNQRYGHVLNPKTGWPVQYLAAVSVVADFCVVAGSASTIAMLKEQDGPAWLQSLGLQHLWVDVQGRKGGDLAIL